jgi:hypothetical protein
MTTTGSVLRDMRIGRLLKARGCRAIAQAERGGSPLDNVIRMAEWRNRYAVVPIEQTIARKPT